MNGRHGYTCVYCLQESSDRESLRWHIEHYHGISPRETAEIMAELDPTSERRCA